MEELVKKLKQINSNINNAELWDAIFNTKSDVTLPYLRKEKKKVLNEIIIKSENDSSIKNRYMLNAFSKLKTP